MAATRAYVRGSGGKFAGASAKGTKVTYGRAGGFANAAFRSRVAASRKAGGTGARGSTKGRGKKFLTAAGKRQVTNASRVAAAGFVGASVASLAGTRSPVLGAVGGVVAARAVLSAVPKVQKRSPVRNPAGKKIKR